MDILHTAIVLGAGKPEISEKKVKILTFTSFTLIFIVPNICMFENIKEILLKHAFNLNVCVL